MSPQILVFGLPRTGTQSILDALELLGFSWTYHMRNVEKCGHIDAWIDLINQRSSCGPCEVDFEKLKGIVNDYDVHHPPTKECRN
jgi:hypothetical protein